jgi:hypothetical protein
MERFGYSTYENTTYSDIGDRYGFERETAAYYTNPNTDIDIPLERKANLKITVTSTGKIEEKPLPPLREKRSPYLTTSREVGDPAGKGLTLRDLEKTFASPWMRKYKGFTEALLHALKGDPYEEKKIIPAYTHTTEKPYFAGCSVSKEDTSSFNGYNIYISMFVTKEVQDKAGLLIYPFGKRHIEITPHPILFSITDPKTKEPLGSASGEIKSIQGMVSVKLASVKDFAGNKIQWSELPLGSSLIATVSLRDPILVKEKGETPESSLEDDITNLEKPYFEGQKPSPENYSNIDPDKGEFFLVVTQVPIPSAVIPLKGTVGSLWGVLLDKEHKEIGFVVGDLNVEGVITWSTLYSNPEEGNEISWEEVKACAYLKVSLTLLK